MANPRARRPRQDVSLRLDWVPTWYHGVFYLALNRGYYSDAGLNMTIGQGRGSATTAQVVGSGTETFGLMDMSTMMLAVGTGAPLVAIGGLMQRSPEAVISLVFREHQGAEGCRGQALGLHRRELRRDHLQAVCSQERH